MSMQESIQKSIVEVLLDKLWRMRLESIGEVLLDKLWRMRLVGAAGFLPTIPPFKTDVAHRSSNINGIINAQKIQEGAFTLHGKGPNDEIVKFIVQPTS
jgi:hypothetical protein